MIPEERPAQLCENCKYGIKTPAIRQCFVDPPTMIGSAPTRPRVNDYEFCSRWWPEGVPILAPTEGPKIPELATHNPDFPAFNIKSDMEFNIDNLMEQAREFQRPYFERGLKPPHIPLTINGKPFPSIEDQIKVGLPQDPQEQVSDEDEPTAREDDDRTIQDEDGPPNHRAQRIGKPPHHRPRP